MYEYFAESKTLPLLPKRSNNSGELLAADQLRPKNKVYQKLNISSVHTISPSVAYSLSVKPKIPKYLLFLIPQ